MPLLSHRHRATVPAGFGKRPPDQPLSAPPPPPVVPSLLLHALGLHSQAGVTVPSVHPARRPPHLQASLPLPLPCSQVWGLCSGVGTPSCLGNLSSRGPWAEAGQLVVAVLQEPEAALALPARVRELQVLAGVCRRPAGGCRAGCRQASQERSPAAQAQAASRACNELWWFCFLDSESEKPS